MDEQLRMVVVSPTPYEVGKRTIFDSLKDSYGTIHPNTPAFILKEVTEKEWRAFVSQTLGHPHTDAPTGTYFYEISID